MAEGSRTSAWASRPTRSPPVRVTRPRSGLTAPARIETSVVLPPPLRPTTPMRSPSVTPSDTPSSSTRVPYVVATPSTLTRLVPGIRSAPSSRVVDDPGAMDWRVGPYDRLAHISGRQCDGQVECVLVVTCEEGTSRVRPGYDRPQGAVLLAHVE